MIKKGLYFGIVSAVFAALSAAALIFTRGVPRILLCAAAAVSWTVFFIRFRTLKYRITPDEIITEIGFFIRSRKIIKRSAILSFSRVYIGKRLMCSVVRTPAKTAVLFCDIPEKFNSVHNSGDPAQARFL